MNVLQPIDELEKWWEQPDPWNYETTPDDLNRRAMLLSALPKNRYNRILDVGCGNGFVTERLIAKNIVAVDVSANAVKHARARRGKLSNIDYIQHSLFDFSDRKSWGSFDLVVITGVLYPQYIGKSEMLVYTIIDNLLGKGGHLVSCHIDEWYTCRFPYTTISREYYQYRQYTHLLEVYLK